MTECRRIQVSLPPCSRDAVELIDYRYETVDGPVRAVHPTCEVHAREAVDGLRRMLHTVIGIWDVR